MPSKSLRNGIFVSYSHTDRKWLERLKVHMKPLERDHNVIMWNDTKLRSGDKWRLEISKALASAKVAILLVSADFLASDFIHSDELPPLLQSASKEGMTILSVIVGHCSFSFSPLSQFQAVNEPKQPLNSISEGQVDEIFFQLFQRIYALFVAPEGKNNSTKNTPRNTIRTDKLTSPNSSSSKASALVVEKNQKRPKLDPTLKKLATSKKKSLNDSALLVKRTGEWEIIRVTQSQISETLTLVLHASTPVQRAFLTSLRQSNTLTSISYGLQTFMCKMQSIQTKTEKNQETWHLQAIIQEFNRRTEMTINGITPDMQAQTRARLLLLNELAPKDTNPFWSLGSTVLVEIKESPFPTLYKMLHNQPTAFKKATSLIATWYLQISNTVEHILKLDLSLKGQVLAVRFEGQRSAYFQESPAIIRVEGTCDLSRSSANTLLLISMNR
jgi:hypothetical protein